MAPRQKYPAASAKVQALLNKADQLLARSNELGEQARTALHAAFRAQELDQPAVDDRERRTRTAKQGDSEK